MAWRPKDWHKINPYELDTDTTQYNAFEQGADAMLNALKPEILEMKQEYRQELAKFINKED